MKISLFTEPHNYSKSFKMHFIIFFLVLVGALFIDNQSALSSESKLSVNNPGPCESKKTLIKILAIDGGGVKGLIPAYIIADLEKRLPQGAKIGEYFDIIAGTSAGGILALMLTTPDNEGNAKYSASCTLEQFTKFSQEVFQSSLLRKVFTGGGLWHVKYSEDPFQKNLKKYFGDNILSQTVTNVIIPAFEIERDKTFFFKTQRAKKELKHDCLLRDLAYATSAAPTYFSPARFRDKGNRTLTLVDGGVSTNNPALAASVHAIEIYGRDVELFVLSLGTGKTYGSGSPNIKYKNIKKSGVIGWMNHITSLMMYSSNEVIDYEMQYILNLNRPKHYFRIQTILDSKHSEMDNITEKNFQALKNYALLLVQNHKEELDCIANVLYKKDFLPDNCSKFSDFTDHGVQLK